MYTIGRFSQINRITTKTLRHYDEIGLLKPEYVDKFTGYRYYTTEQLPKLHKILSLKQMGLALQDIKEVIDNPSALSVFLKLKQEEILENIKNEQMRLGEIRNFNNVINGKFQYVYTPIIKDIPKTIVAYFRKMISCYDELFYISSEIMEKEIKRAGCSRFEPNYCFTVYHDGEYKEKDIDAEVCERVTEMKTDGEPLRYKEIEKINTAVCVLHKGSYSKLYEAYTFIFKWIDDNNYEVIGNPRECYIDGIWNKENEEDWLTEIQVPIELK